MERRRERLIESRHANFNFFFLLLPLVLVLFSGNGELGVLALLMFLLFFLSILLLQGSIFSALHFFPRGERGEEGGNKTSIDVFFFLRGEGEKSGQREKNARK